MKNGEKIDLGPKLKYRENPIPEGEEIPEEILREIPSVGLTNQEKGDYHSDNMDELGKDKEF